ncbi:MAG TPA: lamin tail domain-containing protein [Candidatus Polarisedimenticolia bacterium]|jgi:hypothetical protein|nr:lamin tail domain-containing protein [Candidatus Polarisedimenticolia bacterium]
MKRSTGKAGRRQRMALLAFFSASFWLPPIALADSLAEVSPNRVALSAGPVDFTYDIRLDAVYPMDRVTLAVPGSFRAPTLTSVMVNGAPASYADQSAGNSLAFLLAAPAAGGSSLRVGFRATPPSSVPSAAAVPSTVDFSGDAIPPALTVQGNADGDASDANSWIVAADIVIDGSLGDWSGVGRFLDQNDDATPEKGDLRSGWFVVGASKTTLYARLDVDACLLSGQTTSFNIQLDTDRDGTYDYRFDLYLRGDGAILQTILYRNGPPDANPDNDAGVPYSGAAATGKVPDNGCDQATEWSIPLADIGNPAVVNLVRFESHPSGPGLEVADWFPDYGVIQADIQAGTFTRTGPLLNEVFASPAPGAQWVEITNTADTGLSLAGYVLTDRDGGANSSIALPAVTLPPAAFLVVHLAAGTNDLDFSDGVAHFYSGNPFPAYEAEDEVALYASSTQNAATLADLVAWDDDTLRSADFGSDVADAVAAGLWISGSAVDTSSIAAAQSLGRSGDALRIGAPSDWETSGGRDASDPSPGRPNAGGVVLNEVLMSPAAGTAAGLELYDAGSGSVDVSGWMVGDEDTGSPLLVIPQVGGADLILPSHARVWIALGPGIDTSASLFAPLADPAALDRAGDQAALYFRNQHSASRIVDFVVWDVSGSHSSDWLGDDDLAQAAGIWNVAGADDFVNVLSLPAGHSILRTTEGVDTNRSQDWRFSLGSSSGERDGDQDGLVDSRDNCPDSYNPAQGDLDGDGMGDACDPDQDGDGWNDGLDCAAHNAAAWSVPAAPQNLRFTSASDFTANAVPQATAYQAYRGSRGVTGAFAYNHTCFATSVTGASFSDAAPPALGTLTYYLMSAKDGCGESDLGASSTGALRPNAAACP